MTKKPQDQWRRATLSQQASEWFIKLRDNDLRYSERMRSVEWLKHSPEHIAELLRVQQVHRILRETPLDDLHEGIRRLYEIPNVVELYPSRTQAPPKPSTMRRRLIAAWWLRSRCRSWWASLQRTSSLTGRSAQNSENGGCGPQ